MTTEMAIIGQSFDEIVRIGNAFSASKYFTDAQDAAKAIVKIMAGREMGFGPFASMNGISIIQGKPAVGANLMAAAVKAHPRYDYRVKTLTDAEATIEFYQDSKSLGESSFTMRDAQAANLAGKGNWKTYPRNMLFARAMSNGVRWYTPDVFSGNAVYVPEELDGGGDIIDAPICEVTPDSGGPDFENGSDGEPAESTHWIDDPKVRARFWAWINSEGLDESDARFALGVERVHDYAGSMEEAKAMIDDYIAFIREGDKDEDDQQGGES